MTADEKENGPDNQASSGQLLSDVSLRLWTTIIVFIVLAGCGLPLWWSTTTVYRASLPTEGIAGLSAMEFLLPVELELYAKGSLLERKAEVEELLRNKLQNGAPSSPKVRYIIAIKSYPDWLQEIIVTGSSKTPEDILSAVAAHSEAATDSSGRDRFGYSILLHEVSDVGDTAEKLSALAGVSRHVLIQHTSESALTDVMNVCARTVKDVLVRHDAVRSALLAAGEEPTHGETKRGNLMAVTSTAGYRLAFTLINTNPDEVHVKWDIQMAVSRYVQPFLEEVSSLADFVVDTQVLHYVSSDLVPKQHGDAFHLRESQLPHMINPLESALGSYTSNLSTLHFIVYVPGASQSPLLIVDKENNPIESNAFVVHRWGSVLIHNAGNASESQPADARILSADDMAPMMSTFVSHLKSLLGIVDLPSTMSTQVSAVCRPTSMSYREWNNLLFSRTVENLARSRATLQALVKLLDDVTNMVIADHIQHEVLKAVQYIDESSSQLASGYLTTAYTLSKKALVASEKAFFDPSMLALLYFPEESKYAIYVPLFIPMAAPVASSLFQALKLYKQLCSAKQQQQQQISDKLKTN